MIQTKQIGSLTQLSATEGYIHLRGTDTYARTIIMLPSQSLDDYEEVAEIPTPADDTAARYAAEVTRAIRERYSVDDELAILRQRDTKPGEFADYYAYAEACKAHARAASGEWSGGEPAQPYTSPDNINLSED